MSKLERYKKELLGLEDRTELMKDLIRKEEGDKEEGGKKEVNENEYPTRLEQEYYYCHVRGYDLTVMQSFWGASPYEKGNWDYCHGSIDKSKVEWVVAHKKVVNEIQRHTRPFQKGEDNYCFVRKYRYGVPELDINLYSSLDVGCEYDYFASKDEALKFMYNSTKELLLKYLFKPADGDYKAVMEEGE